MLQDTMQHKNMVSTYFITDLNNADKSLEALSYHPNFCTFHVFNMFL